MEYLALGSVGESIYRKEKQKQKNYLGKWNLWMTGRRAAGEGAVAAHSRGPGTGPRRGIGINGMVLFCA